MNITNTNLFESEQLSLDLDLPPVQPGLDIKHLEMTEALLTDVMTLGVKAHRQTQQCVFVEFYGHVDTLYVGVCESQEKEAVKWMEATIRLSPYDFLDDEESNAFMRDVIQRLGEIKSYLANMLAPGAAAVPIPLAIAN